MMSALGWGGGYPKSRRVSTDKLRECDSDERAGVQNSENFAGIICT